MRDVISELVSKLGGAAAVADAIGASRDSVWMWAKLGRIPWKWRLRVRRMVGELGITPSEDEWRCLALEPERQLETP
jgi:hypothetical protein